MAIKNLFPSVEEQDQIKAHKDPLEGVRAWANVDPKLWPLVLNKLGDPSSLDEVVFIEKKVWDAAVETLVIPANTLRQGQEERSITGAELGRLLKARNCVRTIFGLEADGELIGTQEEKSSPGSASAANVQASSTALVPLNTTAAREIKLSTLVDVTLETKLVPLNPSIITQMFRDFATTFGGLPSSETEPSDDQVSAVKMLLDSGSPPYVDFALFGPHGRRAVKRLMFTVQTWNQDTNKYVREKLLGPGSFDLWWKCWAVLKITLLVLGAAMATPLDSYAEFIREQVNTFTDDCWWIIYQADTRMRSEGMERLRRSAELEYNEMSAEQKATSKFNPAQPWNEVFRRAASDACSEAKGFWDREITQKCVMHLTRSASVQRIAHDGTVIRRQPGAPAQDGGIESAPSKRGRDQSGAQASWSEKRWKKKKKYHRSWDQGGAQAQSQGESNKGHGKHGGNSSKQWDSNNKDWTQQWDSKQKWDGNSGKGGKSQGGKSGKGGKGGNSGKGGKQKGGNSGKGSKPQFNQWD